MASVFGGVRTAPIAFYPIYHNRRYVMKVED